ncbi:hypothetical protein CRE_24823 [Caenorhabditis remanei]|uniref:F-box associated domain-containing protein n=1 Tax=Caenorhabditis remanei TaxID=31234 RepID=E3NHP4_CAERE|nr:hypothetical protein CRE_24823 [Caenorhabditis remanei]
MAFFWLNGRIRILRLSLSAIPLFSSESEILQKNAIEHLTNLRKLRYVEVHRQFHSEIGSDTAQNAEMWFLTDWMKSSERTSTENRGQDIAALLHEYLKRAIGSVEFQKSDTEDILENNYIMFNV